MVFSESITFDGEEMGNASASTATLPIRSAEEPIFIDKLKAGDASAFDTFVDRYSGDVYALLFRLTENAEDARDLTQDTFLRALRSIGGFRGDAELKTWLYRIAINESRNRFRWWKRRRRDVTVSLDATLGNTEMTVGETLSDISISPEDSALRRERETAIRSALRKMPDNYREAIVLCDIEGLSYDETATALGIGIGTVKSRISRGREELRRRLKDF
jgi:RNA polymerase sigma-70 factor (ECF subfamily)